MFAQWDACDDEPGTVARGILDQRLGGKGLMSLQRHAASAASLLAILVAAPVLAQPRPGQQPAQRGGIPKQDTPYILIPVLQSTDRVLGVTAADEIRSRFQSEHSAQELFVITKTNINNTLEASGYKPDSALNSADVMELAKQLRGEYVLEGKVNKTTGNAVHLEVRLLTKSGQQTLAQPLPAIDGKDVGDAAKQVEKAVSEALKGAPAYKLCRSDYMAQKYDAAIKDAQASIAAYPNSTLARTCLLMVYGQQKPAPDEV